MVGFSLDSLALAGHALIGPYFAGDLGWENAVESSTRFVEDLLVAAPNWHWWECCPKAMVLWKVCFFWKYSHDWTLQEHFFWLGTFGSDWLERSKHSRSLTVFASIVPNPWLSSWLLWSKEHRTRPISLFRLVSRPYRRQITKVMNCADVSILSIEINDQSWIRYSIRRMTRGRMRSLETNTCKGLANAISDYVWWFLQQRV